MKLTQLTLDTIPPMVAFFYRLVIQSPVLPAEGFPPAARELLPPLGITKEQLRKLFETIRLPAICGCCRRVRGNLEQGKLYMGCPYCNGYADCKDTWKRFEACNSLLGDWACEPLYCHFLGILVDEGKVSPDRLTMSKAPQAAQNVVAINKNEPPEDKPAITEFSQSEINAILEAL